MIELQVLLPTEILLDERAAQVTAVAGNGAFCLLPRHIDFVTALSAGVLAWENAAGENFVGHSEGILVKQGPRVSVSVRSAVAGTDLSRLQHTVRERFSELTDKERVAVSAVARLEADFVRRYLEIETRPYA